MCGIVSYLGSGNGLLHVLEALYLLQYRAPDSSGVASLVGPGGTLAVRRAVGSPRKLIEIMVQNPLVSCFPGEVSPTGPPADDPPELTDALYRIGSPGVGVGDQPRPAAKPRLSARLEGVLTSCGSSGSPDLDYDPVRRAMCLVTTHVAGPAALNSELLAELNEELNGSSLHSSGKSWLAAWQQELQKQTIGPAFNAAARTFQRRFPGLAEVVTEKDQGRIGGLTAQAMPQVVLGHGRWAMVGSVKEDNAHPLLDLSRTRAVCENGSHNAPLVLKMREEQETWWRARGVPLDEPVHRSSNSTEVIVCEWERAVHQIRENDLEYPERAFIETLEGQEIASEEERALRLALWRLQTGNTHACVFYGQREPGVLYASSHLKPLAIVTRTIEVGTEGTNRQEVMVTSDVNAALMLWDGDEVDRAAARLRELKVILDGGGRGKGKTKSAARQERTAILDSFSVDVLFLDRDLNQGRQIFVRIAQRVQDGRVVPDIRVSGYNGMPLPATTQRLQLDPAMASRGGYDTYTESHLDEIPDMLDTLVQDYFHRGQARLDSAWRGNALLWPGLNVAVLRRRFGNRLERLDRLLLVGEGCSRQAAQNAAPIFRALHPGLVVIVLRPVDLITMSANLDSSSDLAMEVSWSGTTDSVLKADNRFADAGLIRIAITGRSQGDLGRRTAGSGGTVDVHTGMEIAVAAIKGFEATAATLVLLALQLVRMRREGDPMGIAGQLSDELRLVVPERVRSVIEDQERRDRLRQVARRFSKYNKVAVVGNSPVTDEAELKIEKLSQAMTCSFDFHDASLRPIIERAAVAKEDRHRVLFVINATTSSALLEAGPIISYLSVLGIPCIVHTTPASREEGWDRGESVEVFSSPQVSDLLQPLIDAPFFFDLAISLAYARGLSPERIDRPRNLAKSITTTCAERRVDVETYRQQQELSLAEFCSSRLARTAWDSRRSRPSHAALQATVELRAALALLSEPVPDRLVVGEYDHLAVITDTESTENAGLMAVVAWQDLLGIDLVVFRRFQSDFLETASNTGLLRFIRAGAVLSVRDSHTIALPSDMSPLQLELLMAYYLVGLAVRLSRQRGANTTLWEGGLAQLPLVADEMLSDLELAREVTAAMAPLVDLGYDKMQIVGGGQDYSSAASISRTLRQLGLLAEHLHTDSAWHGPLVTVGGGNAEDDTVIILLATDPRFWEDALVEAQIYRTRKAPLVMVVPEGSNSSRALKGVRPTKVIEVPRTARPFIPLVNAVFGAVLRRELGRLLLA